MYNCAYCKEIAIFRCKDCQTTFCNNSTDGVAHIVYHMVKRKHLELEILQNEEFKLVKCLKCENSNLFKMGYFKKEELEFYCDVCSLNNFYNNNLCNNVSNNLSNNVSNNLSNNVSNNIASKLIIPFINLRKIDGFDSKQTYCKMSENFINTLSCIKSKYTDPKLYINTFTALIRAEAEREREIKQNMRQENVTLKISNNHVHFFIRTTYMNTDYSNTSTISNLAAIHMGDEIKFTKGKISFTGFVCNEPFSEELKVEVNEFPEGMNSQASFQHGYFVEYIWRGICYERMEHAVKKMNETRNGVPRMIMKTILTGEIIDLSDFYKKAKKSRKLNNDFNNDNCDTPLGFPTLNPTQLIAIKAALGPKNLTLIQGPPGTGKTLVSAVIVYNLVKNQKMKVFIIAPSNTAVDQLALKINNTGLKVLRVVSKRKEDEKSDVDFLSMHVLSKEIESKINDERKNDTNLDSNAINEELINAADVVCCTCVTAGQKLFNKHFFPIVLIDEAVQCTEPLSLIPCIYGCEKLILVGDHKQLGPTVLSKEATKSGFKQSLFERLLHLEITPFLLSTQYRMQQNLCDFPSEYFYDGFLQTYSDDSGFNHVPDKLNNLNSINMFYSCYGKEEISQSGTSYVNKAEALVVESVIRHLFKNGIMESQIGVITPYEGQRIHILSKIVETGNLEISNVDGFQGREKDYIIVSLVRSNAHQGVGFLADRRRMNVTLTRAKHGLIIIGNAFTLYKNKTWKDLLDWYNKNGQIYEGRINSLKKVTLKEMMIVEE